MGKKKQCEFAIKYQIFKLSDTEFIFKPVELLKGQETKNGFKCTNGNEYPIFIDTVDGRRKYYVDMIFTADELKDMFDYEENDPDFIGDYFFENYKKTLMFVDTTDVSDTGLTYRTMVPLELLKQTEPSSIYYMDNAIPNVVLNEKSVRDILDCKTLRKVKVMLTKYQQNMTDIKKHRDVEGVTRISMTGDKVNWWETTRDVDFDGLEKVRTGKKTVNDYRGATSTKEISYQGLRNYLKERVFGHDEEIDTFAQKLYMNCTAVKGEPIDSILLVGPTGTGKTKTVEYACEYLGLPMIETNASNLVPQGIKGKSMEDVIIELYENAGRNLEKAQKGIVFLDEFDKLNDSDLDLKLAVKNILLTFTAGGSVHVETDHYHFTFDSSMTNKIYAGVFERITQKEKPIGFDVIRRVTPLGTAEEIRKKIIDKKYFSAEELSRITTILPYNDLDRETKKDILMNCKHSDYAKKCERYRRQFGIDIVIDEAYVDAVLDKLAGTTGMRSVENLVKRTINNAEKFILENEQEGYKKLVLTRETVSNPKVFDLSK